MANFYTNVQSSGNYILYRGVHEGKRIMHRIEYQPTLYVPSKKKETPFKTLSGDFLDEIKQGSLRDAKEFIQKYEGVDNFLIYGNTRYEYSFIADQHPTDVDWDVSDILIAVIDIEVGSENGFPEPASASEPITAICIKYLNKKTFVFGCGDYKVQGNEEYIKCKDEHDLCKKFMKLWSENYPDIISGWNIKFFDFPYLINRMHKILGENETRKLSPWNYIGQRTTVLMGRDHSVYDMKGVAMLDYIELYRKYAPGGASQESYKLNNIVSVEVGESKLSYDEYDSLHDLYRLNFQKFIEYNIKDVELIEKLDDKLKLFELALTLAYDSKTNFDDVFAQVRMWDVLIYNHLREMGIVIPPSTKNRKDEAYEGAYVKDPIVGKHDWVASFDLNSLYPHLIMQYNISPEMLVQPENYNQEMFEIISNGVNVDKLLNKEVDTSNLNGVTLTPNGQFFWTDRQGFLPAMMEKMYEDRKVYKKKAIQAKKDLEVETDSTKRYEIEKRIARYNNLQLAKKVCLNSAYGALGNEYFRFFDIRQAMAITSGGQLSIRWIENKLNGYLNKLLKTEKDYVIASDTDSIYLNLGPLVNKMFQSDEKPEKVIAFMDKVCENKIQPFIDESYEELATYVHAYAQKMQMKREALANKGLWTAKKRYIMNVYDNEGVRYNEPHMKVMGLEMVKSSTPSYIRDKMSSVIKIMMNGTEEELQDYITDFRNEFANLPPEDISFPRGINGIEQYSDKVQLYKKGTPIHVKGAILYNYYLKEKGLDKKYPAIKEGEKIKFAYLKQPNPFHSETVIGFPVRLPKEFEINDYVDYEKQFEKSFVEPLKPILNCMGWTIERQFNLDSFFS
jgi:DNA polymerase elongation subunit (family B)